MHGATCCATGYPQPQGFSRHNISSGCFRVCLDSKLIYGLGNGQDHQVHQRTHGHERREPRRAAIRHGRGRLHCSHRKEMVIAWREAFSRGILGHVDRGQVSILSDSSAVSSRVSGSSAMARRISLSSDVVGQVVSGLIFGMFSYLFPCSFTQADDKNSAAILFNIACSS